MNVINFSTKLQNAITWTRDGKRLCDEQYQMFCLFLFEEAIAEILNYGGIAAVWGKWGPSARLKCWAMTSEASLSFTESQ